MFYGVDACRGGWCVVGLDPGNRAGVRVAKDFRGALEAASSASLILVDMPIGLPDQCRRTCDALVSQALGPRAPAVFAVPVRDAVYSDSYAEGVQIQRRVAGGGFSKQAWALVPRIIEIDRVLRGEVNLARTIRESHPELCFQVLARHRGLLAPDGHLHWPKRFYLGIRERLGILERFLPGIEGLMEHSLGSLGPSVVGADDVLDAAALAVHARLGCMQAPLVNIPEPPEIDRESLPMAMTVARLECDGTSGGAEP